MAAEGGPARRMTWLGPDVMVRGFTPDGRIVFVTTQGQPFFRNYRAYALGVDGGLPELLPYGQVNHLSFGPGNAKVIGRNTADPARWKRYRGGTAGHLWVDAEGSNQFRRMSELAGNIASPMWIGSRIHFLSDYEGVGNLYSCRPDGTQLKRHTDHQDFYARHASTDGTRVVYQCGAGLWLFDPVSDSTRRLDIRVPAHRTQAARRFVPAADHSMAYDLHPQGHSLALEARGRLLLLRALGRRGAPARHRAGRALPARALAGRRHVAGGGQRRQWRGADRARRGGRHAHARLGRRPRDRTGGRAEGPPHRDHQPSQRSADRRPRQRQARRGRSQRVRSQRATGLVARRCLARLSVLDQPAPLRDQAARGRRRAQPPRHSPRVPRQRAGLRSRGRATCTSSRCARSTRCTTTCSSS